MSHLYWILFALKLLLLQAQNNNFSLGERIDFLNSIQGTTRTLAGSIKSSENLKIQPRTFENPPNPYSVFNYKKIKDCRDANDTGLYQIKIPRMHHYVQVRCEIKYKGGGWIVIQNRQFGVVDFYRTWADYKNGFGNLQTDFWFGLEKISLLTNNGRYELMIVLEDDNGHRGFAKYNNFIIAPEAEQYKLQRLGTYEGSIGDALLYHLGAAFSTYDRKNNRHSDENCAISYQGAWWYRQCYQSSLNSRFPAAFEVGNDCPECMVWTTFYNDRKLRKTLMMIRKACDDDCENEIV